MNVKKQAGDLKKYEVQGFPTILLIDGQGNKKEFQGDRTVLKVLENFAKSLIIILFKNL